ncbi:MAG: hypothetical protein JRE64_11325 [Deltaproteobacteria bacterium]|nr:hypothetical protein [Deltaproteobacteria bacterium]
MNNISWIKQTILLLAVLPMFYNCGVPMRSYIHPTADLTYIKTVAIVPLKNLTQERGVEDKVRNAVTVEVLRRGIFDVVEFGEVDKILREEGIKKTESLISKSIAERSGKRLNIQAFIVGAVEEYGMSGSKSSFYPEVAASLKLIDANSYKILWESTHSVKGATILDQLFGIGKKSRSDLCRKLVEEMFDTLFGEE